MVLSHILLSCCSSRRRLSRRTTFYTSTFAGWSVRVLFWVMFTVPSVEWRSEIFSRSSRCRTESDDFAQAKETCSRHPTTLSTLERWGDKNISCGFCKQTPKGLAVVSLRSSCLHGQTYLFSPKAQQTHCARVVLVLHFFLAGIAMLTFALFMSARMSIYQEQVYAKYGKHPAEALFYNVRTHPDPVR